MKLGIIFLCALSCVGCGASRDSLIRLQEENTSLRARLDAVDRNMADMQGRVGAVQGRVYEMSNHLTHLDDTTKAVGVMAVGGLLLAGQAAQKLGITVDPKQLPKMGETYQP